MQANCVRSPSSLPTRNPAAGPTRLVEVRRRLDVGDTDPDVVDVAAVPQRTVMHGLDAVAVRIEQEGAVVVVAVLRPRAWLAVALVPGGDPSPPERVDVLPRRRREAHVQPPSGRVGVVRLREGEVVPLGVLAAVVSQLDRNRPQHGFIEALGGRTI